MCAELLVFKLFERLRWPEAWFRGVLWICQSSVFAVVEATMKVTV